MGRAAMTNAPSPPVSQAAPPPRNDPSTGVNTDTARLVRWAWYSFGLNLFLSLLHGAVAYGSGSLAVTAEILHNVVDMASAAAVIVGLKLAARKSRTFPYGLYKVENMVAAGVAVLIFFTAYEIAASAFRGDAPVPQADYWMIASLIFTMAVPLIFSHFEMRVARAAGSPALIANAREYRVHVFTTGLALAALSSSLYDLPLDRAAALLITIAVAKTGWDLLVDALRVLLDASIPRKDLDEISRTISGDPAVADVTWITARNAGRVRFVEAGVVLRSRRPDRPEIAITRIERSVRAAMPHIERVLVHAETAVTDSERNAIPVADLSGTISAHFGEAPYFAFVTVNRKSGAVEEQKFCANSHSDENHRKGIRVAEWLVGQNIDRVFIPRSLEGKGPDYVFREAGIEVSFTSAPDLEHLFGARTATHES